MDDAGARDARNVLFDAALAFGPDWRRDVVVLAGERLPGLDDGERAALAREVAGARAAIERWVLDRWDQVRGEWSRDDAAAAEAHVRATYPWLDDANVAHAVSQATYYAWHG